MEKIRLVDELLEKENGTSKQSLTITMDVRHYKMLEAVSLASGISKTKIINLALEREGIFDEEKQREIEGGKNVVNG